MPRESAELKARRYLSEGRLTILHVDGASITASCRGGGVAYDVGYADGAWTCSCPALTERC